MARDSRVGISLEATNRASATIDQVKGSLGGLNNAAGMASKGLAGLTGAFAAGAVLQFGQQIAGTVVQMAQLAGQSELVAGSMRGLAASFGQSSDEMLDALKRASNGTIAEYDLMLGANKAMMLGVAQNTQELEAIMKVALTRGAAMGLSTTQAFDNLVTGLGRGSALILDNLGITMDSLRSAEEEYAASIGKTTSALDDQEKKQAMVNAVLKEAAGVDLSNVEGMASSFAQAQASISDMKVALGELFGPAIAAAAAAISAAVTDLKEFSEAHQAVTEARQNVDELAEGWERLNHLYFTGGDAARFLAEVQAQLNRLASQRTGLLREEEDAQIALNSALSRMRTLEADPSAEFQALTAQEQEVERLTAAHDAAAQALVTNASQQAFLNNEIAGANQRIAEQAAILNAWLIPGSAHWATYQAAMAAATAAMDDAAGTIRRVGLAAEMTGSGLNAFGVAFDNSADSSAKWAGMMEDSSRAGDALRDSASAAANEVAKLGGAAAASVGGLAAMASQAAVAEQALWNLAHAADMARSAAAAAAVDSLRATALQAAGTLGATQAMDQYKQNATVLQQVGGYLAKSGMDALEVQFNLEAMTQNMNDATLDQVRALEAEAKALEKATGSSGGGGARGLASGLQLATVAGQNLGITLGGLQGKVQGALSGAFDVGVNPEDFLPRPDAINENARRLADIMVNGFKGQDWLEEFKAEVPDVYAALVESGNPQQAAAQMLQNFQDGLVPGLIDREAVKEKVKRALLGDANMAALAAEITAELAAELGQNPLQVAGLVNEAMGRGAADTDMNNEVLTQLKSQNFLNGVANAGMSAGVNWGTGFLANVGENVPAQLLDILATLVTPLVSANLARQAGQTGAQ